MVIADIAVDMTAGIAAIVAKCVEAAQANMPAILQIFALIVVVNFVFALIGRAVGFGGPRTRQDREE